MLNPDLAISSVKSTSVTSTTNVRSFCNIENSLVVKFYTTGQANEAIVVTQTANGYSLEDQSGSGISPISICPANLEEGWYNYVQNGNTYYFDNDLVALTGLNELEKNNVTSKFYFDDIGRMQTGWIKRKVNNEFIYNYFDQDGRMLTGWQTIDSKKYYLNDDGVMQVGWLELNDDKYYFNEYGVLTTGWKEINDKWYYFDSDGVMQKGMKQINNEWYYLCNSSGCTIGAMQIGLVDIITGNDTNTYYFRTETDDVSSGPKGSMVKGFVNYNSNTYYFRHYTNEYT